MVNHDGGRTAIAFRKKKLSTVANSNSGYREEMGGRGANDLAKYSLVHNKPHPLEKFSAFKTKPLM